MNIWIKPSWSRAQRASLSTLCCCASLAMVWQHSYFSQAIIYTEHVRVKSGGVNRRLTASLWWIGINCVKTLGIEHYLGRIEFAPGESSTWIIIEHHSILCLRSKGGMFFLFAHIHVVPCLRVYWIGEGIVGRLHLPLPTRYPSHSCFKEN